ncbi:MAG TPA: histidine kinase, partial [Solirubrobacterales bacterium]|nr:histidine kinase [Solirubrobacterales bacterium]
RFKVFLGMAAGVGKTYRMLQEGHAERDAGRDVVIGYLEPHGRQETVEQAGELEVLPRRRVPYRETVLEEMDLPGVLRRAPELCLIDEMAHTNAPGLEHEKRYEDIEDVLDAGIDVFSTVNVQHLESLNDSVCELTGVRVRETMPDSALNAADEIVLMDLTPEALLARLRAGKIYPQERIDSALNNFFKVENLAALREVALRQVAEEVEAKRLVREPVGQREDRMSESPATQAVGERLLALIQPTPRSQRLVRRAWRSAQRLGADLDLLWVKRPGKGPSDAEQQQLNALGRLAQVLGAQLLVEEGDDVVKTVKEVAEEKGSTYVLIGSPSPRTGLDRFRPPLATRLIESLPGIDIRVVADRALREEGEEE